MASLSKHLRIGFKLQETTKMESSDGILPKSQSKALQFALASLLDYTRGVERSSGCKIQKGYPKGI